MVVVNFPIRKSNVRTARTSLRSSLPIDQDNSVPSGQQSSARRTTALGVIGESSERLQLGRLAAVMIQLNERPRTSIRDPKAAGPLTTALVRKACMNERQLLRQSECFTNGCSVDDMSCAGGNILQRIL